MTEIHLHCAILALILMTRSRYFLEEGEAVAQVAGVGEVMHY
eukprot:SAG25_NODE_13929_length_261_cov_0.635802_1_plen_41_part_10